jgi:Domain of unknown function (DUF4129)
MGASGSRIAAAVIGLTTLICVVAVAGDGPLRTEEEPYIPTRDELREIGVITSDFPVPGALPPEIFPAESYGLGPPDPPAWLLWALAAAAAAFALVAGVRLARKALTWRFGWFRLRFPRWWRRQGLAASSDGEVIEPAEDEPDDDALIARQAVDAALAPLREPADPRAAVIEAYARMEQVLAARQLGRRAPEAPREYLRRVLHKQGMPEESLTTLTALFEKARWSHHPIPESASRRAASELETARVALAETGNGA